MLFKNKYQLNWLTKLNVVSLLRYNDHAFLEWYLIKDMIKDTSLQLIAEIESQNPSETSIEIFFKIKK